MIEQPVCACQIGDVMSSISHTCSDDGNIKWTSHGVKTTNTRQPRPKQPPPFRFATGPTPRTKREKTPLQVFKLFFTGVILQSIVTQTNLFAAAKGFQLHLYVEELQAFIAMVIAMGMLRLPRVRDYWCTDEMLSTPWFPAVMSRDRFFKILSNLHVVGEPQQAKKGEEGYDVLFKVRPLIDHLAVVFPQYYKPAQHLSVDEMMIGTRCRISFLQYLPNKPTKFGIKVFVAAEAKTGYVLAFRIYTGKVETSEARGSTHQVVVDLLEPYYGKNHIVFTDNFYTSPILFLELKRNGTYATGTIRQNRRNFPRVLLSSNNQLNFGNYRFATSSELVAVLWRDRKDVSVLTTAHNATAGTVMKRPQGSRQKVAVTCPHAIIDYNMYMGGVDLTDQCLSYYSLTSRRTIKWWKKIIWRMIDIAILNSWLIFRTNFPSSRLKSHRMFRIQLVHELVQPYLDMRATAGLSRGRQSVSPDRRLQGKHFPYKSIRRLRCVVCSKKRTPAGQRKDTKTMVFCPKCNVHMCLGTCFEEFHTRSSIV